VNNKKCIIKLENIFFSYPGSGKKVLDGLNLDVFKGDKIGMVAPNGSGKTTLFHTIMGLCKPESGSIEIFGKYVKDEKDFYSVRSKIGLLFQDSDDQLFCPTVIDDVAFGPLNLGAPPEKAVKIAENTLQALGIRELENCITHRLSGGQKRLVALASVLAMEPEVLLLDEPTSGLDTGFKEKLVSILVNLDITCIVISHEFDFLSKVTNTLLSMDNGKILTEDDGLYIHQHKHMHKLGRQPHKHI